MSEWIIAISGLMYVVVAYQKGFGDRPGFGLMYFGYFIGAIGALWDLLERR